MQEAEEVATSNENTEIEATIEATEEQEQEEEE